MREDRIRWDRKYAAGNPNPDFEPDPLLQEYHALLDGRGRALDVACGVGHNALDLAARGYDVLGIDGSVVALRYAREAARRAKLAVAFVALDLGQFAPPPSSFSLVVVFRYLDRTLIPRLLRSLRPGGLLIYKSFNTNLLRERPDFNPDYLLDPGESAALFAGLEPIGTNDSTSLTATATWWVGRCPGDSGPAPSTRVESGAVNAK